MSFSSKLWGFNKFFEREEWYRPIIIILHTYRVSTVTYYCDKILFGEEEYKHDKPKVYTSFNTRFWIADKLKIIKYVEEKSFHAASDLY